MFKLMQLLNRDRQIKELKEIQKEKEEIRKKLNEYEFSPIYPAIKMKMYQHMHSLETEAVLAAVHTLSHKIASLLCGTMSSEEFTKAMIEKYRFADTDNYFRELGNYFIALSEYNETRQPLEERLGKLCEKERKLKEKLGIK